MSVEEWDRGSEAGAETFMIDRLERPLKVSERLARDLARRIVSDDLAEGTRLPVEHKLASSYGVGRASVREALRLLETRGVLRVKTGVGGGPVVRRPRPNDLAESLTLLLQFEAASLGDVIEAREALEATAAGLAASRVSDETLSEMDCTVEAMRTHPHDHGLFLQQNARFHSLCLQASGSVILRIFSETLHSVSDGAIVGVEYPLRHRMVVADVHERIIAQLRDRNESGAEQAMREHLRSAAKYWQTNYPELMNRPVSWVF